MPGILLAETEKTAHSCGSPAGVRGLKEKKVGEQIENHKCRKTIAFAVGT